jgi:hypothetical protein
VRLHPLERAQGQQPHSAAQNVPSANVEVQAGLGKRQLLISDKEDFISGRNGVAQLEAPSDDGRRFRLFERLLDHFGVLGEEDEDFSGFRFGQERGLDVGPFGRRGKGDCFAGFADDGREANVRVLKVSVNFILSLSSTEKRKHTHGPVSPM